MQPAGGICSKIIPRCAGPSRLTEDVGVFIGLAASRGITIEAAGRPEKSISCEAQTFMLAGDFLREAGFEIELRGKGAQVNWELALALQARQEGARFVYDPGGSDYSSCGPRFDDDNIHRGGFDVSEHRGYRVQ